MPKYLHIQEAPYTDSITEDGHVGAKKPWPVVTDAEGVVHTPSYALGMRRVPGFQRDLAQNQVDLWINDAFADPEKAVGMYVVSVDADENMGVSMTAVDSAVVLDHDAPLPLD